MDYNILPYWEEAKFKLSEIFGLRDFRTKDDVRRAYKDLVLKYHPDKGGDPEKFRQLQEVYEKLR